MSQVYLYMGLALLVSGVVSYLFGNVPDLMEMLYQQTENGTVLTGTCWVVILLPLVMILGMHWVMQQSKSVALSYLLVFAVLFGMSLSSIFLVYTLGSILIVFGVTAGMFLTMSIIGYTTKVDLSGLRHILLMALIGLIIAMVVNLFLGSPVMDFVVSIIGVLLFTVMTAYDTQKIKNLMRYEEHGNVALYGALTLYLDFINLFLFLLRLFGRGK